MELWALSPINVLFFDNKASRQYFQSYKEFDGKRLFDIY
jgi:hypothetical protein